MRVCVCVCFFLNIYSCFLFKFPFPRADFDIILEHLSRKGVIVVGICDGEKVRARMKEMLLLFFFFFFFFPNFNFPSPLLISLPPFSFFSLHVQVVKFPSTNAIVGKTLSDTDGAYLKAKTALKMLQSQTQSLQTRLDDARLFVVC